MLIIRPTRELVESHACSRCRRGSRPRARVRGPLPLLGPGLRHSDRLRRPGNFATNVTAGSTYGYLLVWVVIVSNLMAMLIQYLSAKAGIATGKSLPALCREHFPRPVTRGLWVQGELVAIATDLAEVVGGAIALKLLFDVPLLAGGLITAAVAFALLALQTPRAAPVRGRDHRAPRRDPGRVPLRRRAERARGPGDPQRHGPRLRGQRQPAPGRRHARSHRDATRDLPPRWTHQQALRAHDRVTTRRPPAQPAHRRRDRDDGRRSDEPLAARRRSIRPARWQHTR